MDIVCRTVLDLRSPLEKYVSQVLLLAASWHRHCRHDAPLEVLVIGEANSVITDFLDDLGITRQTMAPGRNDDFSKTGNKIEAAYPDAAGRRLLLLDNDVAFFGAIDELAKIPANAIAASIPGYLRVTDAQWALIEEALGVPLMRRRYESLTAQVETAATNAPGLPEALAPERYLYLNSGVVLFPAGLDHRAAWSSDQRRVHDLFEGHPLSSGAVRHSDQAGFAASVARHGEFSWLPLAFNYRRGGFHGALATPGEIRIVHFTGDVAGKQLGVAQRCRAYWDKFVFGPMAKLPLSEPEEARRQKIATAMLDATLLMIRDYDLESRLSAYRASRSGVVPA